jgi:hypothetical protein
MPIVTTEVVEGKTLSAPERSKLDELKDGIGRTELVPESCPCCRSRPAALRIVSTRVYRCRFCNQFSQRRDDGSLAAVPMKGMAR